MKLKRYQSIIIVLILVFVFIVSFGGKSEYYEKYKKHSYAFFPHYSTINNSLSQKDREIADSIIAQATEVFTFIGEEIPEKDVGKLERYYRAETGIDKIDFEIEPIAGNFGNKKGYVWIVYSVARLDEKGETISGSWDIPRRWEAEKQDDGTWKVTDIDEAP